MNQTSDRFHNWSVDLSAVSAENLRGSELRAAPFAFCFCARAARMAGTLRALWLCDVRACVLPRRFLSADR